MPSTDSEPCAASDNANERPAGGVPAATELRRMETHASVSPLSVAKKSSPSVLKAFRREFRDDNHRLRHGVNDP